MLNTCVSLFTQYVIVFVESRTFKFFFYTFLNLQIFLQWMYITFIFNKNKLFWVFKKSFQVWGGSLNQRAELQAPHNYRGFAFMFNPLNTNSFYLSFNAVFIDIILRNTGINVPLFLKIMLLSTCLNSDHFQPLTKTQIWGNGSPKLWVAPLSSEQLFQL